MTMPHDLTLPEELLLLALDDEKGSGHAGFALAVPTGGPARRSGDALDHQLSFWGPSVR